MRIADKMNFEQVKNNLSKNRSEMAHLQNQAATQKRVTKPSDDPIAATRVLGSRVELSGTKQYLKNLDFARNFLEYTDQSLNELTEHLVLAKELALSQANDASANRLSRGVVATEMEQIYNQIVQISNRQYGDRYVFGGFKTTKAPFSFGGNYKGDSGEIMVHIDKGSFLAVNIPGSKVFLGRGLSKDGVDQLNETQARTIEELQERSRSDSEGEAQLERSIKLRNPAFSEQSASSRQKYSGVNLFDTIEHLITALRENDKQSIQGSLEEIDSAISQVVVARSQVGSRVITLNSTMETLQKSKIDSRNFISQMEDADFFNIVSDINKVESTLNATLSTSGRLVEKSLMDFLG